MMVAPSYQELECILMARSIYLPVSSSPNQESELLTDAYKKFEIFYHKFYHDEDVQ